MARGISRFVDRGLRYGWKYDKTARKITHRIDIRSPLNENQTIILPRGDFRFWLSGGGGGGCGYIGGVSSYVDPEDNSVSNIWSHTFNGTFSLSAGGMPGRCAFDVHIPNSLIPITIKIGKGGTRRLTAGTAGSGGSTTVNISKLNITAIANGGGGGIINSSTYAVTKASSGSCSISGTNFVQRIKYSQPEATKRSTYNSDNDIVCSSQGDGEDSYLTDLMPPDMSYGGSVGVCLWIGYKEIATGYRYACIPSYNKPTISGYTMYSDYDYGLPPENGDNGYVIIERL